MLTLTLLVAWPLAILIMVFSTKRIKAFSRSKVVHRSIQTDLKVAQKAVSGRERDRRSANKLLTSLSTEPYEAAVSSLALAIAILANAHAEPLAAALKRVEDAWLFRHGADQT